MVAWTQLAKHPLVPAVGIGQQPSGMGSVLINPQRRYCFSVALIGVIKLNSAS